MNYLVCAALLLGCGRAEAAPQLRLLSNWLNVVATLDSTATASFDVFNWNDGKLDLTITPLAPWLSAVESGTCAISLDCHVIEVKVDTTGMAIGRVMGAVRVSDAAAINAPRDVVVIVDVGGGFPDHLTCTMVPGGRGCSQTIVTPTNNFTVSQVGTLPKGVVVDWSFPRLGGAGLGQRVAAFSLNVGADSTVADGLLQTAITLSGLGSGYDDKTILIDLQTTREPIAGWTSAAFGPDFFSLYFDVAAGVASQAQTLPITNRGLGELSLASVISDSAWLSATLDGNAVTIVADPSQLASGHYAGTVMVQSNSSVPIVIPVLLDAFELGAPSVISQEVPITLASGDIVTLTGRDFTTAASVHADTTQNLPTSLNGVRVLAGVEPVALLAVSYDTIQFQVPNQIRTSSLTVERDGVLSTEIPVLPTACQPFLTGIFDVTGKRVDANDQNAYRPPPVAPGSAMTIFGHGFGLTTPPVPAGAPITVEVAYEVAVELQRQAYDGLVLASTALRARLVPGLIGIYRIDTTVPNTPSESADLSVRVCGVVSRGLQISVQ